MNTAVDCRTLDQALALARDATRHETPFDGGVVVWHRWGRLLAGRKPLVLLHGGSGSWNHWVRNIGTLVVAGREVWVPDLPGFGDSDRPATGEDADALPEPIEQGLQVLLGDAACDLVGFSFGGMVAGFMAERWPQRVARLVLVGAAGLGIEPAGPIVLKPWMLMRDESRLVQAHRHNLAALMLWRPGSVDDLAVALHAANLSRDRLTRRRISRTDVLRRSLRHLSCPVCGIYGAQDVLFRTQHVALAEALADAPGFRGLQLVADAGHWVQYEEAAAFNQALAAALSDG
ncbi:MAG: alpha/beta fold hydrolase [Ideonella sp.]|nr:alpha/beta fold hydrolase [Ideonella sp.]